MRPQSEERLQEGERGHWMIIVDVRSRRYMQGRRQVVTQAPERNGLGEESPFPSHGKISITSMEAVKWATWNHSA